MTQQKTQPQAGQTKQTGLQKLREETVVRALDQIANLQKTGQIAIPKDYSVENALQAAWLMLQETETKDNKPVLAEGVCTKISICNALLKMSIQGMNVMKKHGYFIAYGNQLTWQNSYLGNVMMAKRDAHVKEVNAQVIYEGDAYKTRIDENGVKQLVEHETELENINFEKIRGAYAVVVFDDGRTKLEDMTIGQIRKAWEQGSMKGKSGAHLNFTDQMCKKTVMSRACKIEVGSTDDKELLEGILEDDEGGIPAQDARDSAIKEAEKEKIKRVLTIEDAEEIKEEPQKPEEKPKEQPRQEQPEPPPVDVKDDMADKPKAQEQRIPDF